MQNTLSAQVASQAPFDPEEMLFIYSRCMEDNLKDDASRVPTLLKWKDWELEPADDPATHCYVKCVLDKMGMYNPSATKFNVSLVLQFDRIAYLNFFYIFYRLM